ncbi:hypothetical protein C8R43DRAFT_1116417 [Mycena crocata]|nr:hypothetical protein C8R43DRAFT_1116417 [Mycena crocata]
MSSSPTSELSELRSFLASLPDTAALMKPPDSNLRDEFIGWLVEIKASLEKRIAEAHTKLLEVRDRYEIDDEDLAFEADVGVHVDALRWGHELNALTEERRRIAHCLEYSLKHAMSTTTTNPALYNDLSVDAPHAIKVMETTWFLSEGFISRDMCRIIDMRREERDNVPKGKDFSDYPVFLAETYQEILKCLPRCDDLARAYARDADGRYQLIKKLYYVVDGYPEILYNEINAYRIFEALPDPFGAIMITTDKAEARSRADMFIEDPWFGVLINFSLLYSRSRCCTLSLLATHYSYSLSKLLYALVDTRSDRYSLSAVTQKM